MPERDWDVLVGQHLCITTNGETCCGLVTEIIRGERPDGGPEAVFDWGMAIALRDDTTWEYEPPEQRVPPEPAETRPSVEGYTHAVPEEMEALTAETANLIDAED